MAQNLEDIPVTPDTLSEIDSPRRHTILHLQRLAHGLDSSIRLPGGYRIGLDAVIGIIPFVGDALGALLSTYIVVQAARLGATTSTLFRMMVNVVVESIVGIVPLIGDLFDMSWKANNRNVSLLTENLPSVRSERSARRRLGVASVSLILTFVTLLLILMLFSVIAFVQLLGVLI